MKHQMLILLCIIFLGCNGGEDEIIVIPENYVGKILILYNQEKGAPAKYSSGKRVYEIPSDGVLKTQFSSNKDWRNFPDFYYGVISDSTRIRFEIEYDNLPSDSAVAYGGSSGSINKDHEGKEVLEFVLYFIGNREQISKSHEKTEKEGLLEYAN